MVRILCYSKQKTGISACLSILNSPFATARQSFQTAYHSDTVELTVLSAFDAAEEFALVSLDASLVSLDVALDSDDVELVSDVLLDVVSLEASELVVVVAAPEF